MRMVNEAMFAQCDLVQNEYALGYNRYVVDYCETTPKEEQEKILGLIH